MSVLGASFRRNDSVELEVDDEIFLTLIRGNQVVRVAKDVYEADGITFDFTTETASWDDEKMTISPLQADDLKAWFERHADKANMTMVKPKLEEKLNPDVAREIAKYGGKTRMRRKNRITKTRKMKRMIGGEKTLMSIDGVSAYIRTLKACERKGRDPSSLSFLVKHDISQSAAIKLGNTLEEVFNLAISEILSEKFVRSNLKKNVKGERQKDILMINEETKDVIYAEIKANINLDTQKAPATVNSTIKVVEDYKAKGYTVRGFVIALRYLKSDDIPTTLAKKYQMFKEHDNIHLIGIDEFITVITNETMTELKSYDVYSEFLTMIAKAIEVCS